MICCVKFRLCVCVFVLFLIASAGRFFCVSVEGARLLVVGHGFQVADHRIVFVQHGRQIAAHTFAGRLRLLLLQWIVAATGGWRRMRWRQDLGGRLRVLLFVVGRLEGKATAHHV